MEMMDLSSYRGKKNVVLYFYPKDGTPACTIQAIGFSDREDEFKKLDTIVFGVSRDDVLSHQAFRDEHGLTVNLLADMDVQPTTLQPAADPQRPLVLATKSADQVAPTTAIVFPSAGSSVKTGTPVRMPRNWRNGGPTARPFSPIEKSRIERSCAPPRFFTIEIAWRTSPAFSK